MDALFSRKTAMIAHMENRPRNVSSWLLTVACAAIAGVVTPLQPMWAYPVPPATENPASRSVTFALQQESAPALPTPYEHWIADFDGMLKRGEFRALVVYSKSAFFYDQGLSEGSVTRTESGRQGDGSANGTYVSNIYKYDVAY